MKSVLPLLLLLAACGGEQAVETPEAAVEAPTENAEEKPADKPEEAAKDAEMKVFFVSPKDGETVKSPVEIVMGIEGMKVEPAGKVVVGSGHHHLIIGPAGVERGTQVPKDATHIHFGKGQTTAKAPLKPGKHTLTLQFADGTHVSYGEVGASTITITVEE